jgi:solute carrier family 25 oxoglutarate transporter 11
VISKYGVSRLYTGLDSALLRQATYTTTRMGIYKTLMDWSTVRNKEKGRGVPMWEKSVFSITAGGLASIVGNPADLALIRMQADHNLPEAQRRNYTGVMNALTRIVNEEGVFTLWRGCTPTVMRAMALNFGMLGPYDQAKETLQEVFGDFQGIRIASSLTAATFACVITLPFDNVKTKFQKMTKSPDGTFPYKNFLDCFGKSYAREGFFGLYVGFNTFVARIAPHVIITLLVQDFLQEKFNRPK